MLKRFASLTGSAVEIPPESLDWIRARQLAAFRRFGPAIALANTLNALFISGMLWDTRMRYAALVWSGIIIVMVALFTVKWYSTRHLPDRATASERSLVRNLRNTALLALAWGAFPAMFFATVPHHFQIAVAVVTVGMLCGGGFMLATLPRTAVTWIAIITVGSYIALAQQPVLGNLFIAGLLTVYVMVLVQCVLWVYAEFVRRHLGERLANDQAELIGLLLHDFEEVSSDWLWRTDTEGRICAGIERFDAAGSDGAQPDSFASLLLADPAVDELTLRMAHEQGFSDVEAQLAGQGQVRWVSLTGRPRYENGMFAGYQGVASDITEVRASAERIAFLASHDPLTGLANRTSLSLRLEQLVNERQSGSVLLLDLDRFKVINDTMGHATGDKILVTVADRLRHIVGASGDVYRMGGDEFAVVLAGPRRPAYLLARQIVDAIELPITVDDVVLDCSTSIGIRHLDEHVDSVNGLLSQADIALYRAKARGHGYVVEFDCAMDVEAQEMMRLERDLRSAIERSELHMEYQPLVDVRTRRTTGCEALLRWTHPEQGPVWPDRFIAIAERCGLIVPLGEWVIRNVVEAASRIDPSVRVALNVSPVQLRQPNLVSVFAETLAEFGVDPGRIDVEITESVLLADNDANLAVLGELRRLGMRISLDDFGTGYSSFSYLRKFSFDKLKIDKSFVDPLVSEPESVSIVGSINALAKALQMRTVAEGVETERHFEAVRFIGCDQAQGYLFSRPLVLDDFIAHLDAESATSNRSAAG